MKVAFVTTKSITQGEHVKDLWAKLYNFNIDIFFCYKSFKWSNNAKDNKKLHDEIIGCGFVHDVSTATARISEVKEDKFLRVLNIDS